MVEWVTQWVTGFKLVVSSKLVWKALKTLLLHSGDYDGFNKCIMVKITSRELSKPNCDTIKIVKIGPNELVNEEHLVMSGPQSKTKEIVITLWMTIIWWYIWCSKQSPCVIWCSKQSTEQHLLSLICWPSLVAHWTFNLNIMTAFLINLVSWINSAQTCHHPFLSRVKVLVGLGQSPVARSDRSGSSPCPSKWAWIVLLLKAITTIDTYHDNRHHYKDCKKHRQHQHYCLAWLWIPKVAMEGDRTVANNGITKLSN